MSVARYARSFDADRSGGSRFGAIPSRLNPESKTAPAGAGHTDRGLPLTGTSREGVLMKIPVSSDTRHIDVPIPHPSARPLLFIDVDGPLNPYAAKPHRRPPGFLTYRMMPPTWIAQREGMVPGRVKPLRVWLNPEHGVQLLALAERFELAWATTWEHDANTHIAPEIGLPALPVVAWKTSKRFGPDGTYFKTAELVEYAAGRPFAWVDDELSTRDRRYVEREHSGRALLHWVDPAKGLLKDDFAALAAFAEGVES